MPVWPPHLAKSEAARTELRTGLSTPTGSAGQSDGLGMVEDAAKANRDRWYSRQQSAPSHTVSILELLPDLIVAGLALIASGFGLRALDSVTQRERYCYPPTLNSLLGSVLRS